MYYLNPLFLIPVTTGPIFMLAGFVMLKFPPKKINSLYGYRTKSAMENQERWDFAQSLSSKLMIKYGFYLSLTSILGLLFKGDEMVSMVIGLGLMFLTIIVLFVKTEKAIRQKFGQPSQE